MQDSIKTLIKKFKEHDPFRYSSNKENQYKKQSRDNTQNKEQATGFNKRVKTLENTVDTLVTDANRVIKYYQQLLRQQTFNNQQIKEEFANYKLTIKQQKKDTETQLKQLTERVDYLHGEISKKDSEYVILLQKYQDYEECTGLLRKEDQQNMMQMQEKIVNQCLIFDEKITHAESEAKQAKSKLAYMMTKIQGLQSQNDFLKKLVQELMQENQDLKEQFLAQPPTEYFEKSKCEESEGFLEYDFECMSRQEESQQKIEQIRMCDSREIQLNCQKQLLNISEHYSKYNRTEQILSKERSPNYQFVMMNSNQSKPSTVQDQKIKTIKGKDTVSRLFSNGMVKINTGNGKKDKSVPRYLPQQQTNIKEVKEFKMVDTQESPPIINPYKAFFQLMTQCQKMNSPHFWKICSLDLNYLYTRFIAEGVPYNFWQSQIRKALDLPAK